MLLYFQVVSHLSLPHKLIQIPSLLPTLFINYCFEDYMDWCIFIV